MTLAKQSHPEVDFLAARLSLHFGGNFCRVFTQRAAAIVAERSSVPLFTAQPTGKCDLATFTIFFSAFRLCSALFKFPKERIQSFPTPRSCN
jgi:hypothetical protein